MIFFTVTLRSFIKYHSPPCFPSCKLTKNAETHPPLMCDVIIEHLFKRHIFNKTTLSMCLCFQRNCSFSQMMSYCLEHLKFRGKSTPQTPVTSSCAKKPHTDQIMLQVFLLCVKRNGSQTFKISSCKKCFLQCICL